MRFRLAHRTVLALCLFGALCVAATGIVLFSVASTELEGQARVNLALIADDKTGSVLTEIEALVGVMKGLTSDRHVERYVEFVMSPDAADAEESVARQTLIEHLQPWAAFHTGFDRIDVLDGESGEIVASTDVGEIGKFKEDREWFLRGREGTYFEPPYFSLSEGRPVIYIAAPVRNVQGTVIAVLAGLVAADRLGRIAGFGGETHPSLDVYLVNARGVLVTAPRFLTEKAILRRRIETDGIAGCVSGRGGFMEGLDYRKVAVFGDYRWLAGRGLCLVTEIDRADALRPVRNFAANGIAIAVALLLLAVALGYGLAGRLVRPVISLRHAAERLVDGDAGVEVPTKRTDELGDLARSFNAMKRALAARESDLVTTNKALTRSNEELQQFAYIASHDLREPLRMIGSYVQLLARRYKGRLDADADDFIAFAVDGVTRMQRLLDGLLSFSRVRTHGQALGPVDLNAVFSDVLMDLEMAIADAGAAVTADSLPTVWGDPAQLGQVLLNLINNAIKFRSEQAPRIHVSAKRKQQDWIIAVADNGIGIAPEFRTRVFEIFKRLHTADKYPGEGLGLAIVSRIIDRHGGTIWIESEPGKGSTFFFNLSDAEIRP